MITLFATLAALAALAYAVWQAREKNRIRHDLTERMADFREQRDAAVRAVRWVPMKDPELARLAKTGCRKCHGAGVYQHAKPDGEKMKAACLCVFNRIANDPQFGALGDGTLVRLATQAELDAILPNEKSRNPEHGADVIPIGAAR